ncbi:MAG: adenosine deaminase, partial [Thermoanaerobaculia bacterium]
RILSSAGRRLERLEVAPRPMTPYLADCHLHFEGCLPEETVRALALRAGHRFADAAAFAKERGQTRGAAGFLALYAEVCRLFRGPEDYFAAARAVAERLFRDGVAYAEVYVSPEVFSRLNLPAAECLAAVAAAFAEEGQERARCRILLDAVRHWGSDSAERVLDLYERRPVPGVVGFGLGGDEAALPAAAFADVYLRARALGLRTSVHAGEWAGADSVVEALDTLRPDRIDHGVAAAASPALLARLAEEGTVLLVAPTSNCATGAVASLAAHPLARLLEAGVHVAICADDPLLFATSTKREYEILREQFGLGPQERRRCAENAWRAAFCTAAQRQAGLAALAQADL